MKSQAMEKPRPTFNQVIPERKCPKCGKNFVVAPEHIYHVGHTYYCSWTCYLHRNDKEVKPNNDQGRAETVPKHKN